MINFFERAEEQIFERWRNSLNENVEAREKLFLQQLGLQAFKEFFHQLIVDGDLAERDIRED